MQEDIDKEDFCRKLKLVEYFHETVTEDQSLVKSKSNFVPPSGRNDVLDETIRFVKALPPPNKKNKATYNIKLEERNALKELSENRNLTIKEADKGSAVVLMDSNFYRKKIENILLNENAYERLSTNNDNKVMSKLKKLVNTYKNILTEKEAKYLTSFEFKSSYFYGLPKIHKSKSIINEIKEQKSDIICLERPDDLSFRPIVAGPNCPTHRLSHIVDRILQPFLTLIPSYIKNSVDVLNKLPNTIEESTILITIDVEALYSNITHDLGLNALEFWLSKYPNLIDRFSIPFVLESTKLILENNTFIFDEENYRQLTGTAMGTKFAPAYAALSLGFLEHLLYEQIQSLYSVTVYEQFMNNYKRYLDDILLIIDEKYMKIEDVIKLLNNLDSHLNFKHETSGTEVNFLDIKIYIKNRRIETDIYYKTTDTKQYLQFSSCHPRHTKNAIPYSLARRVCTIVSDKSIREKRLDELFIYLRQCGYPNNIITTGISKASKISRKTLLSNIKNSNNKTEKILPYVTTHNPNYNSKFRIVREAVENLKCDTNLGTAFGQVKILNSKRQNKNLKQILTRAEFRTNKFYQVTKCQSKKCKICEIILEGNTFKFKEKVFIIHSNMSCNTLNCIYAIQCGGCDEYYIGETNNFRYRTNLHKDHVRRGVGLAVSMHINTCTTNLIEEEKFKIMPILKMQTDEASRRKKIESNFIKKYSPTLNRCQTTTLTF